MFFSSHSVWNMLKDSSNQIQKNMIGYPQNPYRINEDGSIPISPVGLITPVTVRPSS